jgi:nucleotide-binding universal stress UspA family protein
MIRTKPFVVVAAVDGSDLTASVLQRALDAAAHRPDHDVHVVRVVEEELDPIAAANRINQLEAMRQELDSDIAGVLDGMQGQDDRPSWRISTHVAAGIPTEEVASLAADVEAQLIVLGRHGDHARRGSFVGSAPERLLRLARCPVLVVQPIDYSVDVESDEPEPELAWEEATWRGAA